MLVKATIRLRHAGCFSEQLSGRSHVAQVSGDHLADVLLAHAEDERGLERVLALMFRTHAEKPEVVQRTPTSVLLRTKHPRGGMLDTIAAQGGTILWPALYRDGHEVVTVVAADRAHLERIVAALDKLGSARIESAAEIVPDALDVGVSLPDLTHGLTARQLHVLRLAIESGYYDSPRRTSTAQMAAAFGVARSTLEEHLRKAERAVLREIGRTLHEFPALAQGATRKRGRPPKTPLRPTKQL